MQCQTQQELIKSLCAAGRYNRHNNDLQWAFHRTAAALCTVILSGTALRLSLLAPRRKIKNHWEEGLNHRFLYDCILFVGACVSRPGLSATSLSVSVSERGTTVITFTTVASVPLVWSPTCHSCRGKAPYPLLSPYLSLFFVSLSPIPSLPVSCVSRRTQSLSISNIHTQARRLVPAGPTVLHCRANIKRTACQQPLQRPTNNSWYLQWQVQVQNFGSSALDDYS